MAERQGVEHLEHTPCDLLGMDLTLASFDSLPSRSLRSWGMLISQCLQHGQGARALDYFVKMLSEGTQPDKVIFICILKACGSIKAVDHGMKAHDQIIQNDFHCHPCVASSIIDMYGKCGCLREANTVFNSLSDRNVVSWGVMMTGYIQHGCSFQALELFESMQRHGVKPDRVIFLCLLKACSRLEALKQGRMLHHEVVKLKLESDVAIGSTLLDMYAKCASLNEADNVFDQMPRRNMVPYNALMAGYVQHGDGSLALTLFQRMQEEGIEPTKATFLCIIKACGDIRAVVLGKQTHNLLLICGMTINVAIGNSLIDMYAKCGYLEEACKVFDELPVPDDVSYGAMAAAYVQNGDGLRALKLLEGMKGRGIKPDNYLFSSLLKACGTIGAIESGKLLHDQVKKSGYEHDVIVGNTLIDMYAKCGHLTEAREVFDGLPTRTGVSWGAIIAGYALHGLGHLALEIFERMQQEGVLIDKTILPCVLKACVSIKALECGQQVHDQHIRKEIQLDPIVGNALIDMYIRCEKLEDARKVFDLMSGRDVVTWSTMAAGYVQDGQALPALELFAKSQEEGIAPDRVLILCVLQACGSVGTLELGKLIHDMVIRRSLEFDVAVGNTLLDTYTKCRSLEEAKRIFEMLGNKNVVSWNAMIAGFSQHGCCGSVFRCFGAMLCQSIEPDTWTFSSILAACSEAALVEDGYHYFTGMKSQFNITPTVDHYNCLIDLFGRAGRIQEAKKLLRTMPTLPDVATWMSLLTASWMYGYVDLGMDCFNEVSHLEPDTASVYALCSHMYADFDLWQHAGQVQELKKCSSAWKKPGRACIEAGDVVHEFTVGEDLGLLSSDMDEKSRYLERLLREQGYTPKLELVFGFTQNV